MPLKIQTRLHVGRHFEINLYIKHLKTSFIFQNLHSFCKLVVPVVHDYDANNHFVRSHYVIICIFTCDIMTLQTH